MWYGTKWDYMALQLMGWTIVFYINICSFITDISSGTNNEFSSTVPSRLQKPFVNLWQNFKYFNFYGYVITTESGQVTVWCKHWRIFFVSKLLCFIEMQDGGRRHLEFGHYFTFDVNVELCTAQSFLMSSVVKIGAMVPKLQCFF